MYPRYRGRIKGCAYDVHLGSMVQNITVVRAGRFCRANSLCATKSSNGTLFSTIVLL